MAHSTVETRMTTRTLTLDHACHVAQAYRAWCGSDATYYALEAARDDQWDAARAARRAGDTSARELLDVTLPDDVWTALRQIARRGAVEVSRSLILFASGAPSANVPWGESQADCASAVARDYDRAARAWHYVVALS